MLLRPPTVLRSLVVVLVATLVATAAGPAALAAEDPYRPRQWALDRIGAERAWEVGRGAGAVVAVIDSGVDLDHPDLADNLLRDEGGRVVGRDFVDGDRRPRDEHGHGTLVAGVAAAVAGNGRGVAGTAPEARIMPVRVLDRRGRGTSRAVDRAIRWAVDRGADVVNLSLEGDTPTTGADTEAVRAPVEAIRYAWSRGVVVVAAAGNTAGASTDYPDGVPVLVVGATTRDNRVAGFSDAGRRDAVVAPGVDIVSTWCREQETACGEGAHTYGRATGTSFAAPQVSAAIAVLRGTGLSAREAVGRLRSTARDVGPEGRDAGSGHGLIDLAAAVGRGPTSLSALPERTAPPAELGGPTATPSPAPPAPVERPTPVVVAPGPSPRPQGTGGTAPPRASPTGPATTGGAATGAGGGTVGAGVLVGLAVLLGLGLWGAVRSRGFR